MLIQKVRLVWACRWGSSNGGGARGMMVVEHLGTTLDCFVRLASVA